MANEEDVIKRRVKSINLDDPQELLKFVENPMKLDAIVKLKNNLSGVWRDNVISFAEGVQSSYDVEHIKQEVNTALHARSKQEKVFGNLTYGGAISIGLGILWWMIFNFATGLLLFIVLATCFYIGYTSVNKISKQYYSGDTLRIISDFKNIIK